MGTETEPYDPSKRRNSDNLEEIKKSIKRPHWTHWLMLFMTFIILLLTAWMAFNQNSL